MLQIFVIDRGDDGIFRDIIQIPRGQVQRRGFQYDLCRAAFNIVKTVLFPKVYDIFPKIPDGRKIRFPHVKTDGAYDFRQFFHNKLLFRFHNQYNTI